MPTPPQSKQVSFTASYVCDTKFSAAMLRVLEIPQKYLDNTFLNQKLKDYEQSQYIYINRKKLTGVELDTSRKYKVYLLFEDFTDKKGEYVLYINEVLIKDKGALPEREFNSNILSDSDNEAE
jgi:hypothetical protein